MDRISHKIFRFYQTETLEQYLRYSIQDKPTDMKRYVQTLRTNRLKKAQLKLSKHKELGVRSKIDIHEVASLMDTVSSRANIKNEPILFSLHMN